MPKIPERVVLQIYLPQPLKEWIDAKAKKQLLPPSTWVRSELETMRRGELDELAANAALDSHLERVRRGEPD